MACSMRGCLGVGSRHRRRQSELTGAGPGSGFKLWLCHLLPYDLRKAGSPLGFEVLVGKWGWSCMTLSG